MSSDLTPVAADRLILEAKVKFTGKMIHLRREKQRKLPVRARLPLDRRSAVQSGM